jgi:guanylate kinase
MGRLVILSGPSCVGKGPLLAALKKFYPETAGRLTKFVLYDSRAPRPGEVEGVDYHFRRREDIEALRSRAGFDVFEVRNDLQAMDTNRLAEMLGDSDVLFEGNPFIGSRLLAFVRERRIESLSVFLSPLSAEEITELKAHEPGIDLPAFVTDVMRRKLLRRTQKQKGLLSRADLDNIEIRASSAYGEMQQGWRFDDIIANHDGEDSDHWDAFYYPIGDARRTLKTFACLLAAEPTDEVEHWDENLLT